MAKEFLLLRRANVWFTKEPNHKDGTLCHYSASFPSVETNHILSWWEVWFQNGSISTWSDLNAEVKVTGPSMGDLWEIQDTSYLGMDPKVPDLQTSIKQLFNLSIRKGLPGQGKIWVDWKLFLFILIWLYTHGTSFINIQGWSTSENFHQCKIFTILWQT